ncbi:MAG: UbiA-like polyprenyltransferase [Gemmataceae bacterium]
MLAPARKLLELIRFSHTIFALPFALASAAIAWKIEGFRWLDLVGVLLGMVMARSFAMAFNRLVDRKIDAGNPRTQMRHLPAGTLSVATVTTFTIVCAIGFIASTTLFLLRDPANPWPLWLSVPVLIFLAGYSYTKRFTRLAHAWLGVSLALAPIAAWIAVCGMSQMTTPIVLGVGVLFWVTGFDLLYACQDAEFDRKAGLHSIPASFGIPAALRIAAILHLIAFAAFLVLGFVCPQLGWIYRGTMIGVGLLLAYQHMLVSPKDLSRVNQAFFHVNAVISVAVLAAVLVELIVAGPSAN